MKRVQHLVIDSGALLRNAAIHEWGESVYTVDEVVSEIKDRATLARLQVLPYELKVKEPSLEDVQLVTSFSKKTGDFPTLSATDIKVLGLTLGIHKERNGADGLRDEPCGPAQVEFTSGAGGGGKGMPGFFMPEDGAEEDASEESEGEEGWITPGNLMGAKEELGCEPQEEMVSVACMTTDFAMQNVLKQMGLLVVSVEGIVISETRTYILRCYSCYKTTSDMSLSFCPKCGNKTLKRVSVTLNPDGTQNIYISSRRPLTAKGKRFPLPRPRGGPRANQPLLNPDQKLSKVPHKKKWDGKTEAMTDEYLAGNSPFATRDVYSKAALMGAFSSRDAAYWNRRNPNQVQKNKGNKRK